MKKFIGFAVLAFAAMGNAWADDFATVVDAQGTSKVVSGATARSANDAAWTINDYVNARSVRTAQPLVISTADNARLIDDAARSL